ncbi:MAG: PaaI family thioesterase [Desulfobacteraceae bacterium]|nr:MAG: PaaI family thioesterase [Desulfobacteraceae bacterium]
MEPGRVWPKRLDLPKLENHNCFACGASNPIGLKLHFYYLDENICTDIVLGPNYMGWENMAHGGIITALLDETMAWAVIFFKRSFFVTRKIEVKYIRPVPVGTPLCVKARMMPEKKNLRVEVIAELWDGQNRILSKGTGEFAILSKEQMALVPEEKKMEMQGLFDQLPPL